MTSFNTKLILFGGHSGTTHLQDLLIFDTDELSWSEVAILGSPPKGLRGHTANLIGQNIYIFGGYDGTGRSNDLYIYNVNLNKWLDSPRINDLGGEIFPSPRQRHTACSSENEQIYVFGGFDGNKWLNDLYILDIGFVE